MTFVVLTAGIDLSVGSLLALTGIILSKLFNDVGLPAPLAVLAAIGIAALIGAGVNGVLIGRVGLSFFVVTLGTLSLYQGIVSLWSHTQTTYVTSTFIGSIGFGQWLGIPTPIWIMLGTYIAAFVVLRWTYFGRDVYAVGGNIEAARLSGINVARTLIIVYGIAGMCAGIAGCIQVGRLGAASPMVGADVPLDAAAACCSAARASSAASAACRAPPSGCSSSARSRTGSRSPGSRASAAGRHRRHPDRRDRDRPGAATGASRLVAQGPPAARRRREARSSRMSDDLDVLWQPLKLRGATLPNRVMSTATTLQYGEAGMVSDRHRFFYRERARGGVGTAVHGAVDRHATQRHGISDGDLSARRATDRAPRECARGARSLPDEVLRPARRRRCDRCEHRGPRCLGARTGPVRHRRSGRRARACVQPRRDRRGRGRLRPLGRAT